MGTIRFQLQTDIKDKDGKSFIQLVYQIAGSKKRKSTGEKLFVENWDPKEQIAIYAKEHKKEIDSEKVKKINNKLTDLRRDIEKIEQRFEANSTPYSIDDVLTELADLKKPVVKKDVSSKELYAFIDRYITDNQNIRVHGSLSVYRSLKTHLQGYENKARVKISFNSINKAFFTGFRNYLVGLKKEIIVEEKKQLVPALNDITIAKILSTLKTFLNYAREEGIDIQPIKYKVERNTDLEVIALTQQEFDTLYNLDLKDRKAWDQVRDVFCFSCATGYRYSDLKQLKWHHINMEEGFIQLTAVKTGHRNKVPLNPFSIAILNKYKGQDRPLPVISNQKSNEHLAKLCEYAGFTKEEAIVRKHGNKKIETKYHRYDLVRMHCGRKTFATLSLERGMPAELVMNIGGWKDFKSFKRYMNITDTRAKDAMTNAWGTVAKPKLKAV